MEIKSLNELLETIKKSRGKDLFSHPIIVFDNLKMEQWFKAEWLKNTDKIYMNIKCIRFNDLYNLILNNKYKIYNKNILKKILLKLIPKKVTPSNDLSYILDNDKINYARLYDCAKKLGELFIQYDNDLFDITGTQKELYDEAQKELEDYIMPRDILNMPKNDNIGQITLFISRELTNLEEALFSLYKDNINIYKISNTNDYNDKNVSLFSAPNTLREIEELHSRICKELSKDNNDTFNDYVVYATNVDNYVDDIIRVFKQNDSKYPNVPFVVSTSKDNMVVSALNILLQILHDRYCTRKMFIELIDNSLIKHIKGLDSDNIETIKNIILMSNSYRNRPSADDWKYLKKRIILSKFVGDDAILDNKAYNSLPISDLSLDDNLKVKLIGLIDIIIKLLNIKLSDTLENKYEEFKNIIAGLFDASDSFSVKKVNEELMTFEPNDSNGFKDINIEILMYSLLDEGNFKITEGTPFVSGVTFIDIDEKTIVKAKHAYILGFSSKNYPRIEINNKFELNKNRKNITDIDKETFKKIVNASTNLTISYVNKNLKTDEEYYPCSLLEGFNSLLQEVIKDENNIKDTYTRLNKNKIDNIELDETRDYDDLYTERELKNKNYYDALVGKIQLAGSGAQNNISDKKQELPESLSISKIKDFLDEPLKAKASYLFGVYNSEADQQINEEFESLSLDNLEKISIETKIMLDKIKKENNHLKELYTLQNRLPDYGFNDYDELDDYLTKIVNELEQKGKIIVGELPDLYLSFNEDDIFDSEKNIIIKNIDETNKKINDYDDEISKINDEINQLESEIIQLESEINNLVSQPNATTKTTQNKIESSNKKIEKIKKTIDDRKVIIDLNNLTKDSLNDEIKTLNIYKKQLDNRKNTNNIINWSLTCNKMVGKIDNNELYYFNLYSKNSDLNDKDDIDDLNVYTASLVDIASKKIEKDYIANLIIFNNKSDYKSVSYTIKPSEAQMILNKIYYYLVDFDKNIYIIKKDDITTNYELFTEFISNMNNGSWSYYSDKKMFGYDGIYNVDSQNNFGFEYYFYKLKYSGLFKEVICKELKKV